MSAGVGNREHVAPSEEFGVPTSDKLIADARARVSCVEEKVKKQVEQYIDTQLAALLAEAERVSIILRDTDEERTSRRMDARRKAARWTTDVKRPSGTVTLFSRCLRELIDHVDALTDKKIQTSLMVDLGFVLKVANDMGALLIESVAEGQSAIKRLSEDRTAPATKERQKRKQFLDERVQVRAKEYLKRPGVSKKSKPQRIALAIHESIASDLEAVGLKGVGVDAIAARLRQKPISERS
jgi:hypothetical protein